MKHFLELERNKEFSELIQEIINNETVLQMKNYLQHFDTNCFDHCITVSYYSYLICKKLKLDYVSASRGRNVT